MAKQDEQQFVRVEDYVKGELSKETNWWGAFVVGLAGTILVTGVIPAVLAPLGQAIGMAAYLLVAKRRLDRT